MTTDHAETPQDEIASAKSTLVSYLVLDHTGKGNEISSKQLAEAIGVKPTTVRDMIPEIRREYRVPVVSNSNGYFVVEDKDEYLNQIERFNERIETVWQRKQELERAWRG